MLSFSFSFLWFSKRVLFLGGYLRMFSYLVIIREIECLADSLKGALEYAKLFCNELVNAYDGDLYN